MNWNGLFLALGIMLAFVPVAMFVLGPIFAEFVRQAVTGRRR